MSSALLAGCGTILSADFEAPHACVTVVDVHVPGGNEILTPMVFPIPKTTVRQSFEVPIDSSLLPAGATATKIALVSFQLEAKGGATFAFADSATLSAVAGGQREVVGQYQRPAVPSPLLEMAPDPAADVTAFVQNGKLSLEGALTGTPPAQGFNADATLCFDVAATLQ
jgi:hypothetical protein